MQTEEIKRPSHPRFIDITGVRYGMLTTVGYAGRRGESHYWRFLCDCGGEKVIKGSHVKDGRTRSCGCVKRQEEIIGRSFGRWLVESEVGRGAGGDRRFTCVCICGERRSVSGTMLLSGHSKSCGCLNRDLHTTHGMSNTTELKIWNHMIARCYNKNTKNFDNYGGRGIAVCERWRNSFEAFLEDMGMRPSMAHSIDRFPDNNGNYKPGNCRWATALQQGRNKRNNRVITVDGVSKCLSEWAESTGVQAATIRHRIDFAEASPSEAVFSVSMRAARRDLSGQVFGSWAVIEEDRDLTTKTKRPYWVCRCKCGCTRSVRGSKLTSKESSGCKSCGAKKRGINVCKF